MSSPRFFATTFGLISLLSWGASSFSLAAASASQTDDRGQEPAPPGDETQLRWRFQPGEKLLVKIEQQTRTETEVNARPITMTVNMLFEMEWSVDSVDEAGARMTQEFTRIGLSATTPGAGAVEYDSQKDKNPTGAARDIASGVSPLLGARFQLSMSHRGEILEVSIPEPTAAALAAIPASSRVQTLLSKPVLSDMLRQAAVILPAAPVPLGHQWTTESEATTGLGLFKLTSHYTYRGPSPEVGPHVERIETETTAELKSPMSKGPAGQPRIQIKEHEQKGVMLFDSEAGRLISGEVRQRLVTQQPYREITIVATTETTTKTSIAPKPPTVTGK